MTSLISTLTVRLSFMPALRAGFFFCMQKKNHRKKRQQIKRVLNEILFHPLTRECVNVTSFPYS
ncbi:hypothetical protein NNE60_29540, partial [Escherichia coli]|uniref:hypothetical protein n=1 Tax=Escherichia coli TaxID=562 RepID=UPI00241BE8CA